MLQFRIRHITLSYKVSPGGCLRKMPLVGIIVLVIGIVVLMVGLPIGYSEAPIEMETWEITWFRVFSVPTEISPLSNVGIPVNESILPASFDFIMSDPDFAIYTGSQDEIGLMAKTKIHVPNSGRIRFELGSDDGSALFIDEELAIDNWGLHGYEPRSKTVDLESGVHTLEIWWFEWHGAAVLSFKMDEKVTFGESWYGRIIGGVIIIVGLTMIITSRLRKGKVRKHLH